MSASTARSDALQKSRTAQAARLAPQAGVRMPRKYLVGSTLATVKTMLPSVRIELAKKAGLNR